MWKKILKRNSQEKNRLKNFKLRIFTKLTNIGSYRRIIRKVTKLYKPIKSTFLKTCWAWRITYNKKNTAHSNLKEITNLWLDQTYQKPLDD